ncbi:MAG: hypothetical protein AB8G22_00810 [Saprospiraceae bacterium]
MALTIQLNPDLERQLINNAAQIGVEPEYFITKILQQQLGQASTVDNDLAQQEKNLLEKIHLGISDEKWQRYSCLIQKREGHSISKLELEELIQLSDLVENANVERIQNLIKLAEIREVTLATLMGELGIQPRKHG